MQKIEVELYNTPYLDDNGKFKMDEALDFCGKVAGVCYSQGGFLTLCEEDKEKTDRRIDLTLNSGHHSVYDHVFVSLNFKHLPKIVAMLLNNEHQYTTSEKSARYTVIDTSARGISEQQVVLYNKWNEILMELISEQYGETFKKFKIKKLAMENARYFISVFCDTEIMYTTSLRQINYLASWMKEFTTMDHSDDLSKKISPYLEELYQALDDKNLLVQGLLFNEKQRSFSMIDQTIVKKDNYFSNLYSVVYEGTFAQYAQAHRHRTLHYSFAIQEDKKFFVPPIIAGSELETEWLNDMQLVKDEYPQGELILILEEGRYDDFILKCKERLCSDAQLEIANTTKDVLTDYLNALDKAKSPLYNDLLLYSKGARCTFKDFECKSICNFKEGITLTRKI